jgi:chemotaxis signal transduction protein
MPDCQIRPLSLDLGRDQYIRFFLQNIPFAIPLSAALEIGHRPEITWLPNLPDWVLGVSNIRGEIVSIVDLKAFFRMRSHTRKAKDRFIIIRNQVMKVGIIVDRIAGILSLDRSDSGIIKDSPYQEGELSSYISGIITSEKKSAPEQGTARESSPDQHSASAQRPAPEGELLNLLDTEKLLSCPRMNAFRTE